MLLTKSKAMADSLCGRKRRVPCFFWFLLLFAAGGLVLFIHQQDLSETAPHQGPAMKMRTTLRQSRETLSTQDREKGKSDNYQDFQTAEGILSSTIPPMQFPHFEKSGQVATPESLEQDAGLNRVSKRQRKLLKTTPPIYHNTNVVTSFSSSFTSSSSTALSSASVLSSSATGFISPERWKKLVNIVGARQRLMKEMCATYKSSISRTVTRLHVQNIFVEDKHKLLYCQVPKAGCSNWKRTLIVLAGKASDIQNLKHDTVHNGNHLKTLNHFDQKEATHRLKTYTKVMFVREPLERLVSAYRDKFENPNDYYHSMFGKPIISKYRANASEEALKTGNGVTFQEFAHYLLDVHRPVGMDIHWEQANQLCHPCLIDYDFIGKFENMEEESNFLLRLIGAPPNLRLPSFKDRNPADKKTSLSITHKYFSQVSKLERQRVYDFYYMDYLMFNYSKPFKDLY